MQTYIKMTEMGREGTDRVQRLGSQLEENLQAWEQKAGDGSSRHPLFPYTSFSLSQAFLHYKCIENSSNVKSFGGFPHFHKTLLLSLMLAQLPSTLWVVCVGLICCWFWLQQYECATSLPTSWFSCTVLAFSWFLSAWSMQGTTLYRRKGRQHPPARN